MGCLLQIARKVVLYVLINSGYRVDSISTMTKENNMIFVDN